MQSEERVKGRSLRFGVAAVLVSAGLVIAPGHGVAWADDTGSTSTSSGSGSASTQDQSGEPKDQAEAESPEPEDTAAAPADDTSGLSVKEPKTGPRRAGIEARTACTLKATSRLLVIRMAVLPVPIATLLCAAPAAKSAPYMAR